MSYDRRTLVVSALALIVVIVGGMAIVAITSDTDTSTGADRQEQVAGQEVTPGIIPDPSEGRAPASPNEPGGAEQLALFGLVLAAMAGIGVVVFRGGKRARAGREVWRAAGRSGRDGIMLAHDQLDPDAEPVR